MTIERTPNISGFQDPKVALPSLDPEIQKYSGSLLTIAMNYDDFKVLQNLSAPYAPGVGTRLQSWFLRTFQKSALYVFSIAAPPAAQVHILSTKVNMYKT